MDLGKIQKMVDFFLQLNAWRELKEGEIKMLKEEDLLDVYRASKYRSLGKYIEAEIKGQNWRVKSTDVKNTPVGDFNVVKSINSPEPIYRYDSGAKTMYFNHKLCNQ